MKRLFEKIAIASRYLSAKYYVVHYVMVDHEIKKTEFLNEEEGIGWVDTKDKATLFGCIGAFFVATMLKKRGLDAGIIWEKDAEFIDYIYGRDNLIQ